ncbi:MAG TPA: bifunctional oligoribonuclease/PAP phosphatase NrnA, partial [bacterium]|nr:bifunctional oligoribonuclease/PAP phosphatase NrnA [bacterium]
MNPLEKLKYVDGGTRYERFIDYLKANDHYLITAHIRADGDAIAAICAVRAILDGLDRQSHCVIADVAADSKYSFLQEFASICTLSDPLPFEPHTALILDSPTLDRIGPETHPAYRCPVKICVDHHLGASRFSSFDLIDPNASSTCEILSRLLPDLGIPVTPALVDALYTGLVFDTGNFRFSNTTPAALTTASSLVELGANPEKTNTALFFKWSMVKVRAMAQVLQSLSLHAGRRIALTHLPAAFFGSHPHADMELEGFSDLGVSVDGVKVAVFLKERVPGVFKVSLRAVESYDVGSVARSFGGGGHRKAAGCTVEGIFSEVRDSVVSAV